MIYNASESGDKTLMVEGNGEVAQPTWWKEIAFVLALVGLGVGAILRR